MGRRAGSIAGHARFQICESVYKGVVGCENGRNKKLYRMFPTMLVEQKQLGKLVAQFKATKIGYKKLKSNTAI
jgi:hypothetical protein